MPEGSVGSYELPDLLLSLHRLARTGRVHLERDGVERDLYLAEGWLVAAESSAETDSLEWLLFTAGVLSDDRHQQVRARIREGERRGRALVESGFLSPEVLCDWVERRVRFLASDTLSWNTEGLEYEDGVAPPAGAIVVRLDPARIILTALRHGGAVTLLDLPSTDLVPEHVGEGSTAAALLLPHEAYVLSLADGRRKVAEICALSELGEAETLKTLALLVLVGRLKGFGIGRSPSAASWPEFVPPGVRAGIRSAALSDQEPLVPLGLPEGDSMADLRAIIRIYNEHYVFLCSYMIKEVGPIAEQLLDRKLRETRSLHACLFNRVMGHRDGSLSEELLTRNVNLLKSQDRREALLAGLQDYFQAHLSAVRRVLGPGHEGLVMRRLRELRCAPGM